MDVRELLLFIQVTDECLKVPTRALSPAPPFTAPLCGVHAPNDLRRKAIMSLMTSSVVTSTPSTRLSTG
jgi:hypothetical protein